MACELNQLDPGVSIYLVIINFAGRVKNFFVFMVTTCQMKCVFLLAWGIFNTLSVQANLSFSPYASLVHVWGG